MAEIWNYETIKELLYAPGLGHYFTYGLLAARKINSVWEPVEFIHDVTTDYLLVKKMEELFNRYQLYPIHLRDAIEDMLPCYFVSLHFFFNGPGTKFIMYNHTF